MKHSTRKLLTSSLEPSQQRRDEAKQLREALKAVNYSIHWDPLRRQASLVAPSPQQCQRLGIVLKRLDGDLMKRWSTLKPVVEFLCERGWLRREAQKLDDLYGGQRVALLDEVWRCFPGAKFIHNIER